MNYKTIILEKKEGIATITLNRPDKLNAWSAQMGAEFKDALNDIDNDSKVRVVVITGAGRTFCAGADLNEFNVAIQEDMSPAQRVRNEANKDVLGCTEIRRMLIPFIASINGSALGVGLTLPLACDIRIASDRAKLGAIFSRVGLIPEFGSTYNLPRIIGIAKACELTFTGRIIDATEAEKIGMVNQVVLHEDLKRVTQEMARTIAQAPPLAIQMGKLSLYQGLDANLHTQSVWERLVQNYLKYTEDHKEGIRAFLEKRSPMFKGH
ncbi:MAG: enoyl-CoA hydratase [Deltaproteobacteria bacterium]|nr:enoyl-CoA hydratase [Deltaproteobacteria bacterium]